MEIWKPHPKYPWDISSEGKVRRRDNGFIYKVNHHTRNNYTKATVNTPDKRGRLVVARLMCEAFLGPPPDGRWSFAAHLNGVSTDNWIDNLKWATPKENTSHKVGHGTYTCGEVHGRAYHSDAQIEAMLREWVASPDTRQQDLAEKHGVDFAVAYAAFAGKVWKCVWEKLEAEGLTRPTGYKAPKRMPVGAAHAGAKITEVQALEIRRMRLAGSTYGEIVEALGVTKNIVTSVVTRKTWKHL